MQLSRPLAVITPTLDGPVLTALAQADESFTTGQLVRLLGRGSEEGIRKVLRRLSEQGVVTAEKVGAVSSYRLNRSHLAAEHIGGLANLRSVLLDKIEQVLASWPRPPVYAAVFGTAARGEMRVDSDIDIFLVRDDSSSHEAAWRSQVDDLVHAVTAWTGNDTRPLEYTVSELDAARGEPVLADIVGTGVTVAGQRSWLNGRLRQRRG